MSQNMNNDLLRGRWFIDLDWYERNKCSFLTLARSSLCIKCRKRVKWETEAAEIFETVAVCCAKAPEFITKNTPILTCVLRIFLANRNQPLELDEIAEELKKRCGIFISPEALYRILISDRYYGLHPVGEEVKLK